MAERNSPQPSFKDRYISPEKQAELIGLSQFLNEQFSQGGQALDHMDILSQFPVPICIDFNNVLANNTNPLVPHPDAVDYLKQLRELGNIFIVTTANDHEMLQAFLKQNGMWSDDIVLMAQPSWYFMTSNAEGMYNMPPQFTEEIYERKDDLLAKATQARQVCIDTLGKQGKTVDIYNFIGASARKLVAPLFGKNWPIPIIDDSRMATKNNPNMFGIPVQAWHADDIVRTENTGLPTLLETVPLIKGHLEQMAAEGNICAM